MTTLSATTMITTEASTPMISPSAAAADRAAPPGSAGGDCRGSSVVSTDQLVPFQ